MAYSKRNLLKRIIDVQDTFLQHHKEGITVKHVYDTYIYPVYKISYKTFNTYLAINAKLELKKLEESENTNNNKHGIQGALDL